MPAKTQQCTSMDYQRKTKDLLNISPDLHVTIQPRKLSNRHNRPKKRKSGEEIG